MKNALRIAGAVLAGAIVGILVWNYYTGEGDGPNVLRAKKLVAEAEDRRTASSVLEEMYHRTDCYEGLIKLFNKDGSGARTWIAEYPGGHVECFDGPGTGERNGKKLVPATYEFARRYFSKEENRRPEVEPPLLELVPPSQPRKHSRTGRSTQGAHSPREIEEFDCREVGCN